MKISTADKVRIALAPLHIVLGAAILWQFAAGVRALPVLLVGLSFVGYGVYKLLLVRRALGS